MIEWLQAPANRRMEILGLVSQKTGLPGAAIEKDWWVTLVLSAIFRTSFAEHLVFKGGTSLSKSWGLIERFSEDIDLVLDRSALGFSGELSKTQIGKLRKASFAFISGDFRDAIEKELLEIGLPIKLFKLTSLPSADSDRDPQILQLHYESVFAKNAYLKDAVLIEVGARSLREPAEQRKITSIISQTIGEKTIAGKPFDVLTVRPERTFLEKMFLLHEEFSKPASKIRIDRMSRHLYDLEMMMDTEFGSRAIADLELYLTIIDHRRKFNAIKGIDYASHSPGTICFIPGENVIAGWEKDYRAMQGNMIYGKSVSFSRLIKRMKELQARVRINN